MNNKNKKSIESRQIIEKITDTKSSLFEKSKSLKYFSLLPYNITTNVVALNNIHQFSHRFCESGVQAQLNWALGSYKAAIKVSHLMLMQGKIHFQFMRLLIEFSFSAIGASVSSCLKAGGHPQLSATWSFPKAA